jgi:hypothetical protein
MLRRTLAKNPAQRLRDAGNLRFDLEAALEGGKREATNANAPARKRWPLLPGAIAILVVVGVATWRMPSAPTTGANGAPVMRTTVMLPSNQELDTADGAAPLAISPDGTRLAYVALQV